MVDVLAASKLEWKETEKRMMFLNLLHLERTGLTVEETLNQFMSDDEKKKRRFSFVVTKTDLYSWAKLLLHKDCKHQRALEVFEWMESNNMSLTGYKLAFYIELIAKTKGLKAAYNHFRKIDPYVNDMDTKSKNMPAFSLLSRLGAESVEKSRLGLKDQPKKVYVQHKIREMRKEVCDLLCNGAAVYVAGSSTKMPCDVMSALEEIVMEETGGSKEMASRWLKALEKAGRYSVEAWS
ncbi:hypothetical protein Bca4012_073380 [Brassica carinata]